MFTVQLARAFGQTDVPVPQLDPTVLSIGNTLAQVESNLKQMFNALQIASVAAPNQKIGTEIITTYQTQRAAFAASVQVWIDGYNQTPQDQRNPDDPTAAPILPPDISVLTAGLGRHGLADGILPSQIVVKYGPIGAEKVSGLAASFYDPYFAYAYSGASTSAGLGVSPIVLVLIGLAIVGGVIVAVSAILKESNAAIIARADADRQIANSDAAVKIISKRADTLIECIRGTTDQARLSACTAAADSKALQEILSIAKIQPSTGPKSIGFLTAAGIMIGVAVIAGGGYLIYRNSQRDGHQPRASRMRRDSDFED
jgi:hypothetical protein